MHSSSSKPRVLIVDDTRSNITILVQALRTLYQLGAATSGDQALKYVAAHSPDLILLDVMMPDMDGYEVCQRLKASPKTRAIPVIFITALDEIENKTRGFDVGAVDYITKPFEIAEVQARVRTHLDVVRYKRELEKQNRELRRAHAQLEFQILELEARDQLVHAQMSVTTSTEACEIILHAVQQVLGCPRAAAYLPDESGEWLRSVAQLGDGELPDRLNCTAEDHLATRACTRAEPQSGESGEVAVPLQFRRKPLAVLWIEDMPGIDDREQGLHSLWRLASEGTLVLRAGRLAEELESGDLDVSALLDMDAGLDSAESDAPG